MSEYLGFIGYNFNGTLCIISVMLTLCILMDSSFWFDTINLG